MRRKVRWLRLANNLGVTTEIWWKKGLTFLDKSRQFLAIKCDHGDDRKKRRTRPFLHVNSLDCHSKGLTPESRQKWAWHMELRRTDAYTLSSFSHIKNIPLKCILASVIVSVWKRIFRLFRLCDSWIQREWIWIGREQIWERKRKNYLLTMTRIIKQPCYISESFFCTRKHIEVGINLSFAAGPKMLCFLLLCWFQLAMWFETPGQCRMTGRWIHSSRRQVFYVFYVSNFAYMNQDRHAKLVT